jgi:NAD(P)-dependent dehydrogenase (short-subunit alcohol dehydrogenase family)
VHRIAEVEVGMQHRTVVITGASAGIGRAAARAFATRGYRVGLIARATERLEAACREVDARGGRGLAAPADVADAEAVDRAAEQIERTLGPIDVWVNAAMATVFAPFHLVTPEEYRRATEVTYLGFVHGTMAALKRMRPRSRGTILQVGSALGYRSVPLQSAYCGAKAAIRAFTDSIRCELIHDGIGVRLTTVNMPAVNTPQFDWARNKMRHRAQPLAPIFQPEVAARAILLAAERPGRREIDVGRSTVQAIVGNKVAPGLLDRLLARKGYSGQLTHEEELPQRPDNLFEPVPSDHRAHGRFDQRASERSPELWLSEHRGITAALTVGLVVLVAGAVPLLARRS